jgi:hypothetical protein
MRNTLLSILCFALISCANQQVTTPQGVVIKNNQLLSKGGSSLSADGTFTMWSDSTEASGHLGKFAESVLRLQLWKVGIKGATGALDSAIDLAK